MFLKKLSPISLHVNLSGTVSACFLQVLGVFGKEIVVEYSGYAL